jgi:hypothetical protein
MARWHVHIVQMRARDIKVGDVIARDPSRFDGWFRVHEVRQLGDGSFNMLDKGNTLSFTVGPFDLVGLQTPVPLPAEAERNVRREQASHAASQGPPGDGRPAPDGGPVPAPADPSATTSAGNPSDQGPSAQAARREAAAREAMARGDAGGGARALPGT